MFSHVAPRGPAFTDPVNVQLLDRSNGMERSASPIDPPVHASPAPLLSIIFDAIIPQQGRPSAASYAGERSWCSIDGIAEQKRSIGRVVRALMHEQPAIPFDAPPRLLHGASWMGFGLWLLGLLSLSSDDTKRRTFANRRAYPPPPFCNRGLGLAVCRQCQGAAHYTQAHFRL